MADEPTWLTPAPRSPQPPSVEEPGYWDRLLRGSRTKTDPDLLDKILMMLKLKGVVQQPNPVQGMRGEPTAEMIKAMGPGAARRNNMDSYGSDTGDIR